MHDRNAMEVYSKLFENAFVHSWPSVHSLTRSFARARARREINIFRKISISDALPVTFVRYR